MEKSFPTIETTIGETTQPDPVDFNISLYMYLSVTYEVLDFGTANRDETNFGRTP